MAIIVHTFSGAPRGWRVLLGLAFKGLDWETRLLQASKREHKSAEFLALNPRGRAPVVEADGLVLRDSIGILAWLDRRHPEPPLFGKTTEEAAEVWQITMECCDDLRDAATDLLGPVFALDRPSSALEVAEMVALQEAAEAMHAECRFLEGLLTDRQFLAGPRPSAADAVAFPELRLVKRAVETKHDVMAVLGFGEPAALYPNIAAWKARIAELPGVEGTMPPHWQS